MEGERVKSPEWDIGGTNFKHNPLVHWDMSDGWNEDLKWMTATGLVIPQSFDRNAKVSKSQGKKSGRKRSQSSHQNSSNFEDGFSKSKPELKSGKIKRTKADERTFDRLVVHGYGESAASLDKSQDDSSKELTTYKIVVTTGSGKGSGTRAPVYIQMKGETGVKSVKKRLVDKRHVTKKTNEMCFREGTAIAFRMHNEDIGELHSIKVDIDQAFDDECWYCDTVTVKNKATGKQWKFPCHQWIGWNTELGETYCIIESEQKQIQETFTLYQITSVTGSGANDGTCANVAITLYSTTSDTGPLILERNSDDIFQPSKTDVFTMEAKELDDIIKVRIKLLEDDPTASDWFLERLAIKVRSRPNVVYYAACSDCVSQFGNPTDLRVSTNPLECLKCNRFKVTVFTGKGRDHGTSANAFIVLFGSTGHSDEILLQNDGTCFEQGIVSEFSISTPFLGGFVRQMRLSHDRRGDRPEWFVDKVILDQLDAPRRVYEFECRRWLSSDRDDGSISCVLKPTGFEDMADDLTDGDGLKSTANTFVITVKTNLEKQRLDSTDKCTCLYVILYGEQKTGEMDGYLQVSSPKLFIKDDFASSDKVTYTLTCDNPSPLTQLCIGLKDHSQETFVDDVIVYCPETCIQQVFTCGGWLSDRRDNKLTERTLFERMDERVIRKPNRTWTTEIIGKNEDVEVEGELKLVFWGREGRTSMHTIINPRFNEQITLSLEDVGTFFKVSLEFNPNDCGDNSEIFIKRLFLNGKKRREEYQFEFKQLLSAARGPFYSLATDVPAFSDGLKVKQAKVEEYKISIKTSETKGADTSAQASLALVGSKSDSGYRKLFLNPQINPESHSIFRTGQTNYFAFNCVQLGEIEHIILGHDGKESEHDWLVEEVIVTPPPDSKEDRLLFPCGRWISATKHDRHTQITLYPLGKGGGKAFCRDYKVRVLTADVPDTIADIGSAFITLIGTKSEATSLKLTNQKQTTTAGDIFKPGQWAEFVFRTAELGEIHQIVIGHEDEDKKWFVDKIEVFCEQRCEKMSFHPQRWLAKSEGDGCLNVSVDPSEAIHGQPKTRYDLTIETGQQGTTGDVFLTLFGSWGKTEEVSLRKSTHHFQSNGKDHFDFQETDVGEIDKIRFRYVPNELESWDLDLVKVMRNAPIKLDRLSEKEWMKKGVSVRHSFDNRKPNDFSNVKFDVNYLFKCNQHFRPTKINAKPVLEFVPESMKKSSRRKEAKTESYDVLIQTGSNSGKTQDLKENSFAINLIGARGDTGFREFSGQISDAGKLITLTVETLNIGMPEKVILKVNGSLKWNVETVSLQTSKKEFFFPAEVSFDVYNEVSGQINHTLTPMNKNFVKNFQDKQKKSKGKWSLRSKFGLEMTMGKVLYKVKTFAKSFDGLEKSDGDVYMHLIGSFSKSEKFILSQSLLHNTAFKSGQMDEFDLETFDLGAIESIHLGWKPKGASHKFPFEKIQVRSGQKGTQWSFAESGSAQDVDQTKNPSGYCERVLNYLPAFVNTFKPMRFYEIRIKTSDSITDGSTDANVYIQLYGDDLKSEVVNMVSRKDLRSNCFNLGSEDVFIREMENIGDSIRKIRIGHNNSGFKPGWHLAWVEIRELLGEYDSLCYRFECNRWLARSEDDKATERELNPTKIWALKYDANGNLEKTEKTVEKLAIKQYKVHVYTGSVPGAGTDANVFLTLFGDLGDTGERPLKHSDSNINKFEQNDVDVFTLEAADLGQLYKCFVRHDNKGVVGAAWFLGKIEVETSSSPDKKTVFFCERWLSKQDDDKKIERTLYAQGYHGSLIGEHDFTLADHVLYYVKVNTGREQDMGTNASAFVNLFGADGSNTGKMALRHTTETQFKPSSSEEFQMWAARVGQSVRRVDVSHDGLGEGQDWFIDSVEVNIPQMGKNYIFKMNEWIGASKGGGKLEKTLIASDTETVNYVPRETYLLTVHTGDKFQAGTDCRITATFFGTSGTSDPITLPKNESRFERGRKDSILVNFDDIANLVKMRLTVTSSGYRTGWFLEKIVAQKIGKYQSEPVTFSYNDWLNSKTKNTSTVTIIGESSGNKLLTNCGYEVSVSTSDKRGAGTDANVNLILFGEFGDSGELALKESKTNKNKFESNQTDKFEFGDLEDLGQLQKVRIWHDNSGLGASWHLKEVIVRNMKTNTTTKFACDKWLSRSEDDKQISRELFSHQTEKSNTRQDSMAKFRAVISLKPSAKNSKYPNGNLTFQLKSYGKETGLVEIPVNQKTISKNSEIEHDFKDTNLTNVTDMLVNFVPAVDGESVFCQSIQLANLTSRVNFTFVIESELPNDKSPYEPMFIQPKDNPSDRKSAMAQQIAYEIKVFTGSKIGAGTDSNVFITVFGSKGNSGKHKLADSKENINKFERKQLDSFDLKFGDVGEMQKIIIEHDNSGQGAAWYLDRVEILDKNREQTSVFPCQKWFDKTKGDQLISRELFARQQKKSDNTLSKK